MSQGIFRLLTTIAVAAVIIVASVYSFGGAAAFAASGYSSAITAGAFLVGGIVGQVLFPDKIATQSLAASTEVKVAPSGEGFPVAVIFGSVERMGKFMDYSKDTMRADAITKTVKAGSLSKKSSTFTVGYSYYLTWEYGLCMGNVDAIGQVYAHPGRDKCRPSSALTGFGGDTQDLTLSAHKQGGSVRVYRGSATQNRVAGGDPYASKGMNYRNVCWALFQDFKMGEVSPIPNSYTFILSRMPVVGASGIPQRASNNPASALYLDANPAAIVYEMLTNGLWGRNISSTLIDIPSFVAAGNYFLTREIGMSFTLEQEMSLSDALNVIRSHINTIIFWDGTKIVMKVLVDPANYLVGMTVLPLNSIIDVSINRETWETSKNEIRAEFVNREADYKNEVVHLNDMSVESIQQHFTPTRATLAGFAHRHLATRQAERLLKEAAYPQANFTITLNRLDSKITIGDLLALDWSEWSSFPIRYFVRVAQVNYPEEGEDQITLTGMEDTELTTWVGDAFGDVPENPSENALVDDFDAITDAEVNLIDETEPTALPFNNVRVVEPNIFFGLVTPVVSPVIVMLGKSQPQQTEAQVVAQAGAATLSLGVSVPFAIPAVIQNTVPIPNGAGLTDRDVYIDIDLVTDSDQGDLLTLNHVTLDSVTAEQHYSIDEGWISIGDEMLRFGKVDDLGGGIFRLSVLERGANGTPVRPIRIGSEAHVMQIADERYIFEDGTALQIGINYEYEVTPIALFDFSTAATLHRLDYDEGITEDYQYLTLIPPAPTISGLSHRLITPSQTLDDWTQNSLGAYVTEDSPVGFRGQIMSSRRVEGTAATDSNLVLNFTPSLTKPYRLDALIYVDPANVDDGKFIISYNYPSATPQTRELAIPNKSGWHKVYVVIPTADVVNVNIELNLSNGNNANKYWVSEMKVLELSYTALARPRYVHEGLGIMTMEQALKSLVATIKFTNTGKHQVRYTQQPEQLPDVDRFILASPTSNWTTNNLANVEKDDYLYGESSASPATFNLLNLGAADRRYNVTITAPLVYGEWELELDGVSYFFASSVVERTFQFLTSSLFNPASSGLTLRSATTDAKILVTAISMTPDSRFEATVTTFAAFTGSTFVPPDGIDPSKGLDVLDFDMISGLNTAEVISANPDNSLLLSVEGDKITENVL